MKNESTFVINIMTPADRLLFYTLIHFGARDPKTSRLLHIAWPSWSWHISHAMRHKPWTVPNAMPLINLPTVGELLHTACYFNYAHDTHYKWTRQDTRTAYEIKCPTTAQCTFNAGKLHSYNDQPAVINSYSRNWYRNGRRHRGDNMPAVIQYSNGKITQQEWWVNGYRHRVNGPALIFTDGDYWGNCQLWFAYGHLHRTDGPAVINADGSGEYWEDSVQRYDRFKFADAYYDGLYD